MISTAFFQKCEIFFHNFKKVVDEGAGLVHNAFLRMRNRVSPSSFEEKLKASL
jgi:hypothetical protein